MLRDKIEKYFLRDPGLRVLFFFDKDKSWLDETDSLELRDVLVLKWHYNDFYLKTQLHGPLKSKKVFLYFPNDKPSTQEEMHRFPLLDLLMANKELSLENEGEFMQEYGLQRHHQSLVKEYMRELKYSHVQEVCKPVLNAGNFEKPALVKGLISSFLRFNKIESWPLIIGKVLSLAMPGEESELKRFQKKIDDNDLFNPIAAAFKEFLGKSPANLQPLNLKSLLTKIRYNILTQNISASSPDDPYRSLKIKEPDVLRRMQQFLQEVDKHEKIDEQFHKALEWAADGIRGEKLIATYGVDQVFSRYTPEMVYEVIRRLRDKLDINPAMVRKRLEEISMQKNLEIRIIELLRFVIQAATLTESVNRITSFILDRPDDYIYNYTQSWYRIDTAYRKAIGHYRNIDIAEFPEILQIEKIYEQLNSGYEVFCEQLNREWLKCLAQFNFDFHKLKTGKQFGFFKQYLADYDQKIVVIISDALRFEAACELLSVMHGDPKNTAEISVQLAGIPSKTFTGMAQLLPGKDYRFNDGAITIDGLSTDGTENRKKLLQQVREDAATISFSELEAMDHAVKRNFFKRQLVYIYHDVIDSVGDNRKTEHRTFDAVKDAIQELARLVRSLHASYNMARIIITSDHGFLYNDRKIPEAGKENPNKTEALISGNRFEVMNDPVKPGLGYCIPLRATTIFNDNLFVVIPDSVNRYKKQGAGHQFVHGGGSLQELLVPVIESSRKTQPVTTRVNVLLMQKTLSIISSVLRVNLLQENKVSRLEKEREICLGIYHHTGLVSNLETILLNSVSDAPSERMHRIELNLLPKAFDQALLKLKVFDVDDMLNPLIESPIENKNLIEPDF